MSAPVAVIFGAGSNVGQAVAKAFAAKGYKVAVVARRLQDGDGSDGQLRIRGDVADPNNVVEAFSRVKTKLGIPSVVIYNASSNSSSSKEDPLSLSLQDFEKSFAINTVGAFVAAQQAVQGFAQLPESGSKTFIYTGNMLNTLYSLPGLMTLGLGKSASGHLIQTASQAYKAKGYKFYYADERSDQGGPVYADIDGPAHAEEYVKLAEGKEQGPWLHTFVKRVGYKDFPIGSQL